jgi:hypothetical protein
MRRERARPPRRRCHVGIVEQINESPLMKRLLVDLKIFKTQLLLIAFKHVDCIGYSNANLEVGVARLFTSRNNQIAVIDALINQVKSQNYFTEQQIALFERHLFLLSKSVELVYSARTQ